MRTCPVTLRSYFAEDNLYTRKDHDNRSALQSSAKQFEAFLDSSFVAVMMHNTGIIPTKFDPQTLIENWYLVPQQHQCLQYHTYGRRFQTRFRTLSPVLLVTHCLQPHARVYGCNAHPHYHQAQVSNLAEKHWASYGPSLLAILPFQ